MPRMLALSIGLFGLPIAYLFLYWRMARKSADAPVIPFFIIFGTVGGYLVLYGIGPSFFTLMGGALFLLSAFIVLLIVLIVTIWKWSKTRFHPPAAVASAMLLLGIGALAYTQSLGGLSHAGHWEDDQDNWGRAFNGTPVPSGVRVIHSQFTRSPHFTYEASYFFEFTAPEDLMKTWKAQYQMAKVDQPPQGPIPLVKTPSWYMPKPIERYDVWVSGRDGYTLCQDRETGSWFVSETQ